MADLLIALAIVAFIVLLALGISLYMRQSDIKRNIFPPESQLRQPAGALDGLATRFWCTARQLLRRWSWFLLFVGGVALYPVQVYWQVRYAASQVSQGDVFEAAAAEHAKLVDSALLFSKLSIAVGVFCLINLLAWCALNLVLPVLADWAKGRYSTLENAQAVGMEQPVVGFKRTFLGQSGLARIALYFVGFGLQLFAAGLGVYAAFNIQ